MTRTAILGTGHFVPENVVTNDDLAKRFATSDEWIQQRTGIKERHHIDFEKDPMNGVDMGCKAAGKALEMAGLKAEDVDFLIWGTLSADHQFPGNACWAQPQLGLREGTPCMDIRNQCSFFVYALTVADALVRQGMYKRILIVGSEIHSTGLDFSDEGRDVTALFGDGAGAVVVGPGEGEQGILATDLGADGQHAAELTVPMGSGVAGPWATVEKLARKEHYPKMNGKKVFKHAVTRIPQTVVTALQRAEQTVEAVDMFIVHQANLRIVEFVQKLANIPDEKVHNNIQRYGNTTAASIPIALDAAVRTGKIKRGQLVCLTAFGAGFTWGSVVIRF
jgi:3-oxoacyl-[acyl-carrier-protein] synthase-3